MRRVAKGAPDRRAVLGGLAAGLAAPALARGQESARAIVIGGGFGGATAARALQKLGVRTTLVEPEPVYTACPFSNAVIAGLRDIAPQRFGYDAIRAAGVEVIHEAATAVDAQQRLVALAGGGRLFYDRLIVSPGIDLRFDALPGYDAAAAGRLPHAWKAGEQTLLLRRQIEAMPDGGVVIIVAPANPFRCPPGPYERASLIAHYLKAQKPRARIQILDAKDAFSKQRLFQNAWTALYPGMIEWIGLSAGGKATEVKPAENVVMTEFGAHRGDVVNVIPPQRAGAIAIAAGLADRSGWCPIDPATFESKLLANIHVIGDAAIAGGMPKSAFSANAQAKVCARAVADLLRGAAPAQPRLINTCYSLVAPNYGISIAGVYKPGPQLLVEVEGSGGVSPLDAPPEQRAAEADYARSWFDVVTHDVFR